MCRQVVKEITILCSGVVPPPPAEDVDGADGGPVQVRAQPTHQVPGAVQAHLGGILAHLEGILAHLEGILAHL